MSFGLDRVKEIDAFLKEYDRQWHERLYNNSNKVDFEAYEPFIRKEGLSYQEQNAITEFLKKLCKKTGFFWKPGKCRVIPDITNVANDVLEASLAKKYIDEIVPQRFSCMHFFWVAKFFDGRNYIIDPTGVPTVFGDNNTIEPYFGLVDHSIGKHLKTYMQMEDMDDWGTRDLPPGFYP